MASARERSPTSGPRGSTGIASVSGFPRHEPCRCGYCRRQARQEAAHNDQLTEAGALASRWHPKTVASARPIPFDLTLRIELCLERFANRYNGFPRSCSTVNRRVQEAAEQAELTGRIYPHCLRATAASHHAYKGVAPVPLQALMGGATWRRPRKHPDFRHRHR